MPPSPFPLTDRVATRVALAAAGGAGLAGGALALGGLPWWAVGLTAAGAALLAAYVTADRIVTRPLAVARETLRQARKGQFDDLAQIEEIRDPDEVGALFRQVLRAGRALQQEIERLKTVENYRREFLGDVSHELKTPIFAVSGFAESLLDGALEDEHVNRTFVQKILTNAHRLNSLASDLSEISRIETGELRMRIAPFELGPLVAETLDGLGVLAPERRIALTSHIPDGLPAVLGDRDRLRQVLANLTENAVKYNEDGGTVEVTARRGRDGRVRVSVVDNGPGIPAEALPRLTERFYRVDKSRSRQQGGTGLGLAIVKHILEAHGSALRVESTVGYGSAFSFTLEPAPASGPEGG